FGLHIRARIDVVGGLVDIADQNGFSAGYCLSRYAFAYLYSEALNFGGVANLKPHSQVLRTLIDQEDGKDLVRNYLLYQLSNRLQKGIKIKRSIYWISKLEQEILYTQRSGV